VQLPIVFELEWRILRFLSLRTDMVNNLSDMQLSQRAVLEQLRLHSGPVMPGQSTLRHCFPDVCLRNQLQLEWNQLRDLFFRVQLEQSAELLRVQQWVKL
jgi:hypothetical protein